MDRHSSNSRAKQIPKTARPALYDVIYVDVSLQRVPALPHQKAHIAYVRQIGPAQRYLVPQAGHWTEVNEETALQRAEGLRRAQANRSVEGPCA